MTTKEKIDEIIKTRYNNYQGIFNIKIKDIHEKFRLFVDDEQFLEFLKKVELENPKPIYKIPNLT